MPTPFVKHTKLTSHDDHRARQGDGVRSDRGNVAVARSIGGKVTPEEIAALRSWWDGAMRAGMLSHSKVTERSFNDVPRLLDALEAATVIKMSRDDTEYIIALEKQRDAANALCAEAAKMLRAAMTPRAVCTAEMCEALVKRLEAHR